MAPACLSPSRERTLGCYITAREELGRLPRDSALYWHIDRFASQASAETAKGPRGTVVNSLGQIWLFTIADSAWHPAQGERVARIGPLPLVAADSFAAVYMEGIFEPGMHSVVHRHPGVEAWYTIVGEQCVETPQGKQVQRAGGPGVLVPGGLPMMLTGTGTTDPPIAGLDSPGRHSAALHARHRLDARRTLPAIAPNAHYPQPRSRSRVA